jgi:putative intracellular protease/amidase
MPEKAVYLLVVDGFADWEPAHAVAELRRTGGYRIETVGLTAEPVESMAGIRVLPSTTIGAVDPADVAAFILPGGERWERDSLRLEPELAALLERLDTHRVPIAAICAATTLIARLGLASDQGPRRQPPGHARRHRDPGPAMRRPPSPRVRCRH